MSIPGLPIALETTINRKNTLMFIQANPLVLALIPRERERTASGGSKYVDQPAREVQTFRLIPRDETTLPTFNDEGIDRSYDLVLLGAFDAQMSIRDYWHDENGFRYEVMDVQRNSYEVKGAVVRKGNA